ncbi:MAG: type VI secretion system baseplate subunit TssE [Desulfobacteraceae bacterium]|nr:type VI secretion system baseplate subunit TssE [Desulfobacteraceae bacterium]MBC2718945.1 type VI secretion system baseplate subunit TssE [Desulfobacteraceae bacterium]
MGEDRLLERIQFLEKEPARRARENPKRIVDSILRHLQRILNTRQGSVLIAKDYGVPDFTDFLYSYPEALSEIERSIRQMIQKYEPRLKDVRIRFIHQDEDLLSLHFQIVAKVLTEDTKIPVLFESFVSSEGKIMIKG